MLLFDKDLNCETIDSQAQMALSKLSFDFKFSKTINWNMYSPWLEEYHVGKKF